MVSSPRVSVILSVRNGGADLQKAIQSILDQTFSDFEFIIINNGSTDGTAGTLEGIRDRRLRVYHQNDMGLAAALNRGIALARGEYIARQDHDDWAKPTRIEQQVAFLDSHPRCGLVGTRAEIWVGDNPTNRTHDHPTDDAALRFQCMFDNYFVHSSVMIRKSVVSQIGGYSTDPTRQPPEDYELWSRIMRRFEVANLAERLTVYREVPKSMSREGQNPFLERVVMISAENIANAVGCVVPSEIHSDIAALYHRCYAKLSSRYDIDEMCRLIQDAGRRIHLSAADSDLPKRVATVTAHLRFRHGERRSSLRDPGPLKSLMRWARLATRFGRRLLR